jgi:hypothetical protein
VKTTIIGIRTLADYFVGLKDRQQSPVWYGTSCLLIRNTIGGVSCSVEWGLTSYFVPDFVKRLTHMVQEGSFVRNP